MGSHEPTDLKRAAARGVAWKTAAEVFTQVTRLLVLLVLARLLVPAEFGVASIVLAFAIFVPVFADLGLGAALIQTPKLTEVERSTVFWTSLPLGLGFMLLGVGLSWPLAAIFDEPTLQPLFASFSVCFLLASLASVPSALLIRAMNFRALELRVIAGTACGASVSLFLAFAGFGPWAIVGGEIANRAISVVMLWPQCHWRPQWTFSRATLRAQFAYGGTLFGAHILLQFSQTAQSLMVGRLLGSAALGRLTVSQTLVYMPFNRIAAPIQEVMFPTFSRMQHEPARILSALNRINQVLAAIAFPTLTGLAVLAPEFTQLVLGAKWQGTEMIIRVLAVAGMAAALQRVNFSVLSARGYARSIMWVGLGAVASTVVAILVGYHFGLDRDCRCPRCADDPTPTCDHVHHRPCRRGSSSRPCSSPLESHGRNRRHGAGRVGGGRGAASGERRQCRDPRRRDRDGCRGVPPRCSSNWTPRLFTSFAASSATGGVDPMRRRNSFPASMTARP